MNRPEVLAPAGSWETLRAAAFAGADAVYFGGQSFNARRGAANFDDAALEEAIGWLHARGVKAYITFNTLLFENEWNGALAFLERLCQMGPDALIVQDTGVLRLVRAAAPDLRLHASTQMAVHNIEGVRALAGLGVSRVVLARELSAREMEEITGALRSPGGACAPEIEVFVHGALCMSVSGQCYFSAMLGGRSGNRGLCAQVCRLPFAAPGGTGHDLSLKDLSLIRQVPRLARMGVSSLKIEGRMKRPEYVTAAVRACAAAARGEPVPEEQLEELRAVFSRAGFTQGYFEGRRGREMFGFRGHEDVLASGQALARMHAETAEQPCVPVDLTVSIRAGSPAALRVEDDDGHAAHSAGPTPEPALHRALDEQTVREKLDKTGGTPFFVRNIRMELGGGLSLPVRELNALRRDALDELLTLRQQPRPIPFARPAFPTAIPKTVEKQVRVRLLSAAQLETADFSGIERVYLPLRAYAEAPAPLRRAAADGLPLGVELPRTFFGSAQSLAPALDAAKALGVGHALCGNIGALPVAEAAGFVAHGDFSLNCANRMALEAYAEMGAADCVLSFELALPQARRAADARAGLLAYGRLPLMLTHNCPLRNGGPCAGRTCAVGAPHVVKAEQSVHQAVGKARVIQPAQPAALTDRTGACFPVVCGAAGDCVEVLNDRPLWMCDRKEELWETGVSFLQLYFTIETPGETAAVLQAFRRGDAPSAAFTRGLYRRGVR
ncbi:peptidase U32 family protein [Ethanoligenens harbinense]|uniref:Peptidase U32 n=1 Tax=Ethanoligenens harbinense (strain DSM 18485 / JCM 12961 / CGMCC 1.5033 / YUAN-3) TaxID=663278 RepID=E6U7E8_ETHHY|nr:U32 family peptidase [Ethanoligenens harbinense]ADU25883.1 peptidase U32 [Ethanoligenens harbinense YUAN-3]AVQ95043.1 U32 family peptidase [Ethanoligenens harbinense YUAN-3]AYF37734.1 U32 family peptidase [Ethanoligenens harbinense]AYF40455.1 U32 family peptidase [Ethanoligenens harbinense]QCN91290.1 U32 family peptidase [Ethanoligenens harbinense]